MRWHVAGAHGSSSSGGGSVWSAGVHPYTKPGYISVSTCYALFRCRMHSALTNTFLLLVPAAGRSSLILLVVTVYSNLWLQFGIFM